ncbi:hypothetical protein ACFFLS_16920 [Flavobacterium procerum]|uniref:DNA helicase PriA n=1 Tax=Flavobacterium procerum TaxID=1455569 RepID=A0ABV6BXH2_9FLAO
MNSVEVKETQLSTLNCSNCGAKLKYKPGSISLVCEYCNTKNDIELEQTIIEELDFNDYLEKSELENLETEKIIQCKSCGSVSSVDESLKSLHCPYCSSPLLEDDIQDERFIKPSYLLPFNLDNQKVCNVLSRWIDNLWWAPDNLKKTALSPIGLRGVYVPYWAFDLEAFSEYKGEKGVFNVSTIKLGKNKIPIIETNWDDIEGTVFVMFDDVLSPASGNIDVNSLAKLFPWDMDALVKMNDNYLAGFVTEKYKVKLSEGFQNVKGTIDAKINNEICKKIGGDRQRVNSLKTRFNDIKFKHILLPVYVSTYRYNNNIYHFYVNGRTGKIIGERPYSNFKIILAVVFVLLVLTIIIIL